jgi:hypothetical protein
MTDENVMRRLKKLLAMAMDSRANPGEAENAMRMAQKLMAAHNITDGALAASEVDEFAYESSKGDVPNPWESALLHLLARAFGCKHYWVPGFGYRKPGYRNFGHWHVVAEKAKLELIRYAFDVVRRQMLSERSKFVASLPEYYTRPQKAAQGDAFGLAFVQELGKKITTLTDQDPRVVQAIEDHVQRICKGNVVKKKAAVAWTDDAREAGREAGAKANLHRPMNGGADTLRIGA